MGVAHSLALADSELKFNCIKLDRYSVQAIVILAWLPIVVGGIYKLEKRRKKKMTYPTSQTSKDVAGIQEEQSSYVVFETRLVQISEAPKNGARILMCKDGEHIETGRWSTGESVGWSEHIGFSCYDPVERIYAEGFISERFYYNNGFVEDRQGNEEEHEANQPTHFLQFKINGEWTHEFKMGEE